MQLGCIFPLSEHIQKLCGMFSPHLRISNKLIVELLSVRPSPSSITGKTKKIVVAIIELV